MEIRTSGDTSGDSVLRVAPNYPPPPESVEEIRTFGDPVLRVAPNYPPPPEGVGEIRTFGDPVLRKRAEEVTQIDGNVARLCENMFITMKSARGIGLAAPQVGVEKRVFVYDEEETCGRGVIVNPTITESDGTWTFEEGCLSVPGYSWTIERPRRVELSGWSIDGNEINLEAEDLFARLIQHEIDHLDGVLLMERLDPDQRKNALRELRLQGVSSNGDAPQTEGTHNLMRYLWPGVSSNGSSPHGL